jgi:hypothetical protein
MLCEMPEEEVFKEGAKKMYSLMRQLEGKA